MHAPDWAAFASLAPYPWRLFFFLLALSIIGALAVVPYLRVVLRTTLSSRRLPLPLPAVVFLQSAINFGLAIGLGLLLARRLGLGATLLENWLDGRNITLPAQTYLGAGLVGFAAGLVILAIIRSPLGAALSHLPIATLSSIPLSKRLLACFYGGICEEVLLRLFLLSLVLWLFGFFGRRTRRQVHLPGFGLATFWLRSFSARDIYRLPRDSRLSPRRSQFPFCFSMQLSPCLLAGFIGPRIGSCDDRTFLR